MASTTTITNLLHPSTWGWLRPLSGSIHAARVPYADPDLGRQKQADHGETRLTRADQEAFARAVDNTEPNEALIAFMRGHRVHKGSMAHPISIDGLRIEPLDRTKHDRKPFTCGETSLDNYLKNTAARQQDQNLTRVKVGCLDQRNDVIAFHALNAHSLNISELDSAFKDRFPRYKSIPSAYLSMIATDAAYQGNGLGSQMMFDAMDRVLSAANHIGIHFLVLDALNERAAKLYLKLGFERLASNPERMIMSTEKIRKARTG